MAKFKVNDLITDGKDTLWITGLNKTHYIFTHPDGSVTTTPIDEIDADFETYEYIRSHTQKISIEEHKGNIKIEWDAESKDEVKSILRYVLSNFDKIVLS